MNIFVLKFPKIMGMAGFQKHHISYFIYIIMLSIIINISYIVQYNIKYNDDVYTWCG